MSNLVLGKPVMVYNNFLNGQPFSNPYFQAMYLRMYTVYVIVDIVDNYICTQYHIRNNHNIFTCQ